HKHVPLFKGTRIEKQVDTLAGAELAFGVLGFNTLKAATQARLLAFFFELVNDLVHKIFLMICRCYGHGAQVTRVASKVQWRRLAAQWPKVTINCLQWVQCCRL